VVITFPLGASRAVVPHPSPACLTQPTTRPAERLRLLGKWGEVSGLLRILGMGLVGAAPACGRLSLLQRGSQLCHVIHALRAVPAMTLRFSPREGAQEGTPYRISWTARGSDDAFLALDRNGNDTIDDGTELFGNSAPQPASFDPNGFRALAIYDQPSYGGNGDGSLSAEDAIFHRLVLWTDGDHDGVSQAWELTSLTGSGIQRVELGYRSSRRSDRHGNWFRWASSAMARYLEHQPEDLVTGEKPRPKPSVYRYKSVIRDIEWDPVDGQLVLLLAAGGAAAGAALDLLEPTTGEIRRLELELPMDLPALELTQLAITGSYIWFRNLAGDTPTLRLPRSELSNAMPVVQARGDLQHKAADAEASQSTAAQAAAGTEPPSLLAAPVGLSFPGSMPVPVLLESLGKAVLRWPHRDPFEGVGYVQRVSGGFNAGEGPRCHLCFRGLSVESRRPAPTARRVVIHSARRAAGLVKTAPAWW